MKEQTFGQPGNDLAHLLLKANLQNPVGLVNDQRLQIVKHKPLSVFEVVEQPTGRGDEQVDAFEELLNLGFAVRSTHDDGKGLVVVSHQLFRYAKGLQRQFARGCNDDCSSTCLSPTRTSA